MKHGIIFSVLILFSNITLAQSQEASGEEQDLTSPVLIQPVESRVESLPIEESWKVRPLMTLGAAVLFEKTNDQRFQSACLPPLLGIGLRLDKDFSSWTSRIEYAADESLDGNATLSVRRRREAALAWVTRDFGLARGWVPYAALAAGFTRSETVTVLDGSSESNKGLWLGAFAAAVGYRADWSEAMTVRAEYRYESAEALKTNDARSGVAVYLESTF